MMSTTRATFVALTAIGGFLASATQCLARDRRVETPQVEGLAPTGDPGPLWMRYSAISPDGTNIAFIYHGHLFVVPSRGGTAVQLTTGVSHETAPIWSPDGKRIAFASDLHGNNDVYVIGALGGAQLRLTVFATAPTLTTTLRTLRTPIGRAGVMPS